MSKHRKHERTKHRLQASSPNEQALVCSFCGGRIPDSHRDVIAAVVDYETRCLSLVVWPPGGLKLQDDFMQMLGLLCANYQCLIKSFKRWRELDAMEWNRKAIALLLKDHIKDAGVSSGQDNAENEEESFAAPEETQRNTSPSFETS